MTTSQITVPQPKSKASEMVDSYNRGQGYNLPGAYTTPLAQQQVVVNVGENIKSAIAELQQDNTQNKDQKSDERAILKACVDEPITAALISIKTGIEPNRVKELVEHLELEGMLALRWMAFIGQF